mgnify:CR=1 FL=1
MPMFRITTRDQITGHFDVIERMFASWDEASHFAASVATGDRIEPRITESTSAADRADQRPNAYKDQALRSTDRGA